MSSDWLSDQAIAQAFGEAELLFQAADMQNVYLGILIRARQIDIALLRGEQASGRQGGDL